MVLALLSCPICFFKCCFLSIFCLSFDSTSTTLHLGTFQSLTFYHFLFLEQIKKNCRAHLYVDFQCGRLLYTSYGELFSQTDSCQAPVSGSVRSSSECTLAAGEHKIPSVWLLRKNLMCTCTISLGWLWLSGLPSAFASQSEKEQATLETFCYEKQFGMEELMRTMEEYHGVLGTAPILSFGKGGIMDWMWNRVMCIQFGFSLVGYKEACQSEGMKMSACSTACELAETQWCVHRSSSAGQGVV